jgi:hypothetical protein
MFKLDKNGLGYILGDIFSSPSGHPALCLGLRPFDTFLFALTFLFFFLRDNSFVKYFDMHNLVSQD